MHSDARRTRGTPDAGVGLRTPRTPTSQMGHVRFAGSGKGSRLGVGARDVHVVLVETGRRVSGEAVPHAAPQVGRTRLTLQADKVESRPRRKARRSGRAFPVRSELTRSSASGVTDRGSHDSQTRDSLQGMDA